ncbi:MAG: holo-ACP synthase [Planctomycetota bacterium]
MTVPVGLGTDLVEVARIASSIREHGERFLTRCFTDGERVDAIRSGHGRSVERFAARFAVKEAVMKALGTGWAGGVGWTDIEVSLDGSGAPSIALSGRAAEIAKDIGIRSWLCSMTHTQAHASATVIALS